MSVDADNRSSYSGRRSEHRDGFLKTRCRYGCILPDKKKSAPLEARLIVVAFVRERILNRPYPFVPAVAGTQFFGRVFGHWIPAFAGMSGDWFNSVANLIHSALVLGNRAQCCERIDPPGPELIIRPRRTEIDSGRRKRETRRVHVDRGI